MDPKGNGTRQDMGPAFSVDIKALVKYLKMNFDGVEVVEALRRRTMIEWLYPELDPLSRQVLHAYQTISELLVLPFSILDVGCMCGYFKHYLDLRTRYTFRYRGIDRWPEAIQVAKEFFPHEDFIVMDFLEEDIPSNSLHGKYDYVCVNNIQFGKDIPKIIKKAVSLSERAAIFGMPKHCGDYFSAAKSLGFNDVDQFDCGESTVVKVNVNGNNDLCRTSDISK